MIFGSESFLSTHPIFSACLGSSNEVKCRRGCYFVVCGAAVFFLPPQIVGFTSQSLFHIFRVHEIQYTILVDSPKKIIQEGQFQPWAFAGTWSPFDCSFQWQKHRGLVEIVVLICLFLAPKTFIDFYWFPRVSHSSS